MAIQENYFISALELGSGKMKDGVSCKEMFNHLKNVNHITDVALPSFRGWFYNSGFFVPEYEEYLRRQNWDQIVRPHDIDNRFDIYKGFVRGEAYFKYLEYIEVKEALKNSRNSSIVAVVALLLSTVVGIIQIIVSLL